MAVEDGQPLLALLDTSALYALVDSADNNHPRVAAALKHLDKRGAVLVLTPGIFGESMTLLKRRLGSAAAVAVGESLRDSRVARLMATDADDEEEAWAVFSTYLDKAWSWVDCSNYAFMRRHGIELALTLDHHFEQMGVTCFPSSR